MARPSSSSTSKIHDVARLAGVSTATVSRVINSTAKVNAETAERVQKAILELGYVPQSAARNLASKRTNTIGLLLPNVGTDFFSPILHGIETAAEEAGFELLIGIRREGAQRRTANPIGGHNTDGLIVFGGLAQDRALARLNQQRFPIVLLYHTETAVADVTSVVIENRRGSRNLMEHLIEAHGRRRIAFLRGPEGHQDSEWRENGYRQALADHGIPFDPGLVGEGLFSEEGGRAAVEQMLARGARMDAIFAGDDASAIGAIYALVRAGLRVPQDVALVGFDDIKLARYINPPLTTVRAPTEQVGMEAVRQLICRINGEPAEPVVLLQTELVIRQSCGCA